MDVSKIIDFRIQEGIKKYPEDMFCAFCVALMKDAESDYRKFIDGLDLSENESAVVLKGFLERKLRDWCEESEDVGDKILCEFDKLVGQKEKRRVRRVK